MLAWGYMLIREDYGTMLEGGALRVGVQRCLVGGKITGYWRGCG